MTALLRAKLEDERPGTPLARREPTVVVQIVLPPERLAHITKPSDLQLDVDMMTQALRAKAGRDIDTTAIEWEVHHQ